MNKRKMNKECIEEALELCRMLDEDIAVADWFGCSEDTVSYITNSRILLKDLIHDLELERAEIKRLRDFMEGKKMLRVKCPGCGDIINHATQAALEEPS